MFDHKTFSNIWFFGQTLTGDLNFPVTIPPPNHLRIAGPTRLGKLEKTMH